MLIEKDYVDEFILGERTINSQEMQKNTRLSQMMHTSG